MKSNCKIKAWKDRNGIVHLNHDDFILAELIAIIGLYKEEIAAADRIVKNSPVIIDLLHLNKPRILENEAVANTSTDAPSTQPL